MSMRRVEPGRAQTASTGRPAERQASTPPITSPARSKPIARSQSAARLDEYPSRQSRITRASSGSFAFWSGSRDRAATRPRTTDGAAPPGCAPLAVAARRPSGRRRGRPRPEQRRRPPRASGARSPRAPPPAGDPRFADASRLARTHRRGRPAARTLRAGEIRAAARPRPSPRARGALRGTRAGSPGWRPRSGSPRARRRCRRARRRSAPRPGR